MTNNSRLIALWYQQSAISQDSPAHILLSFEDLSQAGEQLANNSLLMAIFSHSGLVRLAMVNLDSYGPFPGVDKN
jgi:hypothetical protein